MMLSFILVQLKQLENICCSDIHLICDFIVSLALVFLLSYPYFIHAAAHVSAA